MLHKTPSIDCAYRRWAKPLLTLALLALLSVTSTQAAVPHLGYGFNVAVWDVPRIQNIQFNWIKLFSPPPSPLPLYVLVRVTANYSSTQNLAGFNADLDAMLAYTSTVNAWEIGNEVNLNADYGWGASPDPVAYANLLCNAYARIKTADPKAIVVSAGVAPVGRIVTAGYVDERIYFQQFLDAGGGNCLDVVGFHPYGFSADYNVSPDVVSSDPAQNCDQGLCFRTAEAIYAIMQAKGVGNKKMWATEFGWLTAPPSDCLTDPSWGGRQWQIVSADKQASNLVGAYQYADTHWPWMGAMFIFNLNFNTDPAITNPCEQMRFYSIQPQAESALTAMPKNIARLTAHLKIDTPSVSWLVADSWQPITITAPAYISNDGWQPLIYTATVDAGAAVVPTVINGTGSLSPTAQTAVQLALNSNSPPGVYAGTLRVAASPSGQVKTIPLELRVVSQVYQAYLPAVVLNSP